MVRAITPERLRAAIDADHPLAVLDVRESLDYAEGHIRECTLVSRHELEDRIGDLVPNRATPVVLVDREGERAPLDVAWLERLGYGDVAYLEGGMAAWREAGFETVEAVENVHSTAFNFESKLFGELVEAREDLPKLDPDGLEALREREDPLVVDVRTPEEYAWVTIPGSLNVEGVDLGLYIDALRENEDQPVVVHCAGRTRSIIGTATLKRLGVENVYELENGTMGWELAGREPEEGADRRVRDLELDDERYERVRSAAEALLEERGVDRLTPEAFDAFRDGLEEQQSLYLIDVRTHDEYEAGHVPGSLSIPGGQAIQTTDQHIAVRDAAIVFVSDTHVRSAITAHWFAEMGFDRLSVLDGGLEAWRSDDRPVDTGPRRPPTAGASLVDELVDFVSPADLATSLAGGTDENGSGAPTVVSIDGSDAFRERHVPGARWIPRYDLEARLEAGEAGEGTVILTCEDGQVSGLAAAQLAAVGESGPGGLDVRVLDGGVDAWAAAGHDLAAGEEGMVVEPRDAVAKPYFQGEREMRTYLEWEENLAEEGA